MKLAALFGAAAAVTLVAVAGLTASTAVPATHLGAADGAGPTAAQLAPAVCASLPLTTITGPEGTEQADLVLGTAAADNLRGKNRQDCLVGGNGNDILNGGPGVDVCVGGNGADTFAACETQIP